MGGLFGRGNNPASPKPEPKVETNAHVIVVGNEKGGSGKTTTTMHILVALMRMDFKVGCVDIDARQRSLSRYLDNRHKTAEREGVSLPMPQHIVITKSPFNMQEEAEEDERERFTQAMQRLAACDFVLIDSPGNDTFLSRLAHSNANTVITPINDSFVDLDVLASVDGNTLEVIRPSIYSEMVWEQKLTRAKRDGGSIEWIVMRNRLSHLDAKNKRYMKKVVEELSRRIGFRMAPGFSERVIYREMFLQGLTVLDVIDISNSKSISMSHIAAKQEVRDLLKTLRIPEVDRRINALRHREQEEAENPGGKAESAPAAASTETTESAQPPADSASAAAKADAKTAEPAPQGGDETPATAEPSLPDETGEAITTADEPQPSAEEPAAPERTPEAV